MLANTHTISYRPPDDLNLRGKRFNQPDQDTAPDNLIRFINQDVWNRPSYGSFHKLLNNYTRSTGIAETITPEKEKEITTFLDNVVNSQPMRVAHEYLSSKDLVAKDLTRFKSQLYQMWFRLYTRETRDDTCGFEHVFVGESKQGQLTGLHNWLQFYNLEQSRHLDYRGYIFPRRRGGGTEDQVTPKDQIISVQFNVDGQVKEVSSLWLGTSPEFELALYTVCFIAGGEKSVIELTAQTGTYEVEIRCYHIRSKYGDKVGSAFPVLLSKQAGAYHPAQGQAPQPSWQQSQGPQPQQAWAHQPPQQQYQPPQQQYYPPPQQQYQQPQQHTANQGCGAILADIFKALFGRK